jgi:radical SAM protein with 4Fe4S-binding SPASM domain
MAGPFRVDLELTARCNQYCIHCMADPLEGERTSRELELSEISRLLRSFARQEVVILQITGGEPTLREDLAEIIGIACRLGYCILLSTNGSLLDPEAARVIAECRVHLELSLDGATAETHDMIRGCTGSFASAVEAAECLLEYNADFVVSTVLLQQNIHCLEEMLSLVGRLGAAKWLLKLPRLVGRAYARQAELCPSHEALVRSLTILEARARQRDPHGLEAVLPVLPLYQTPRRGGDAFCCPAGTSKLGILADGTVVPCLLLRLPLGSASEYNLASASRHPLVQRIRSVQTSGSPQCSDCEHHHTCRGGCRAAALVAGRGLDGRDPLCDLYGRGMSCATSGVKVSP